MLAILAGFFVAPSVLISGGTVYDGLSTSPRHVDIRILADKISEVGRLVPRSGETVINAAGLTIAPGFIDAHSHAERGISNDPVAVSQLTQGITTAVVGQDGGRRQEVSASMSEMSAMNPSINFAWFSGHGGLRSAVMGDDYKRQSTPEEFRKMQDLLAADMKSGALGLSSGLEYDPGYYSNTKELVELARIAGDSKGLYISHMRDEADKTLESISELLQISKQGSLKAQISHIKLGSKAVWGKAKEALNQMVKGRATADVYPYTFWQSTISALSPSRDWANRDIWVKALDDVGGPANVRLTSYTHDPTWVGKTLVEISSSSGLDPITIIQQILEKTEGPSGSGSQSVAVTAMQESDLIEFIKHPRIMFCSDGSIGGSHPRGAGSFPRVLARYVRELNVIPLGEAIRKMTSLPATTFQLKNRGVLRKGYFADIVIFNAVKISDHATASNPTQLSTGVQSLFVNGIKVLDGGKPTGLRGGRALKRNSL